MEPFANTKKGSIRYPEPPDLSQPCSSALEKTFDSPMQRLAATARIEIQFQELALSLPGQWLIRR